MHADILGLLPQRHGPALNEWKREAKWRAWMAHEQASQGGCMNHGMPWLDISSCHLAWWSGVPAQVPWVEQGWIGPAERFDTQSKINLFPGLALLCYLENIVCTGWYLSNMQTVAGLMTSHNFVRMTVDKLITQLIN